MQKIPFSLINSGVFHKKRLKNFVQLALSDFKLSIDCCQLTSFDDTSNVIPKGKKITAVKKKIGKTVDAVKTGCHAFICCCLNGESMNKKRGRIVNYFKVIV